MSHRVKPATIHVFQMNNICTYHASYVFTHDPFWLQLADVGVVDGKAISCVFPWLGVEGTVDSEGRTTT